MISPGCIGCLQYTNFQVIRPSRSEYAGCGRDCVTLRCYDLKCHCPWHFTLYKYNIWAVWAFFLLYGVSETQATLLGAVEKDQAAEWPMRGSDFGGRAGFQALWCITWFGIEMWCTGYHLCRVRGRVTYYIGIFSKDPLGNRSFGYKVRQSDRWSGEMTGDQQVTKIKRKAKKNEREREVR